MSEIHPRENEKAGAVWVIGVSAPAVVTGIYKQDDHTRLRGYISIAFSNQSKRATKV
jgi:hypothetical protein